MRIAFGPASGLPSWEWVGLDTARALGAFHDVVIFDDFGVAPAVDIVVVVKYPPPAGFLRSVRSSGARLVYLPLDHYETEEAIAADHDFLRQCDLVMVHSPALTPFIAPYCRSVRQVEHHCRYALAEMPPYRSSGYLLWIGAAQHLPHVVKWLAERPPPPIEIRLLSNLGDRHAFAAAHFKAHSLGVPFDVRGGKVCGIPVFTWSEAVQQDMMSECRAAFDIKGDDFSQATKPATKAQQFMASGIPFGCNSGSSVFQWFGLSGFDVAQADDYGRLTSWEYWKMTQEYGCDLRSALSLESVVRSYLQAFAGLQTNPHAADGEQ